MSKYVDLSYINDLSEGNWDVVKELIDIFLAQIPEFTETMSEAFNKQDWQEVKKAAHAAKNSLGVMGMQKETAEIMEWEMLIQQNQGQELYQKYFENYLEYSSGAMAELQELLASKG